MSSKCWETKHEKTAKSSRFYPCTAYPSIGVPAALSGGMDGWRMERPFSRVRMGLGFKKINPHLESRTLPRATGVSQVLRARHSHKVWKESPGTSGPGAPKSLEKVPNRHFRDFFQTFLRTFSRLLPDFLNFGAPPGDSFQTFFGISGGGARETPVARGRARNSKVRMLVRRG